MKMNRRNVLLGLGAMATGGGAVFSSGAFSSVQADRGVTLGVTGDTSANLGLAANNTNIANTTSGTGGNQLGINATAFNPDATTEFDAVFDVTNNGNNAVNVAIERLSTTEFSSITFYADGSINDVSVADLSSNYVELAAGATLTVGISAQSNDTGTATSSTTVTIEARDDTSWNVVSPAGSGGVESS